MLYLIEVKFANLACYTNIMFWKRDMESDANNTQYSFVGKSDCNEFMAWILKPKDKTKEN